MRTAEPATTPPGRRWVSAEAWMQRVSVAEIDYDARVAGDREFVDDYGPAIEAKLRRGDAR